MTIKRLIEELKKYDENTRVLFEYSYHTCGTHCLDEMCYCSDTHIRNDIGYLTLETRDSSTGKLLKNPYVLIWRD
jgi:hypothetical protein